MKKILIRLCQWVLKKFGVQSVSINPNMPIYFNGRLYEIQSVAQEVYRGENGELVIRAKEYHLK